MKRYGFTLIEALVVVAVLSVLAAILFPGYQRPQRFYYAVLPPQRFERVELQTVVAHLDQALQTSRARQGKKPVMYLRRVRWTHESLKYRPISLNTQDETTLKEVLSQVERVGKVKFDYGVWCGTGGSPMGQITIQDANNQKRLIEH